MFRWLRRQAEQLFDRAGAWPRVRREHLQREPVCQACGSDSELEVHHITPLAAGGEELSPQNLITLCGGARNCHLMVGHAGSWRKYRPDVRGICQTIQSAEVRSY